jgi:hypothetical protein
MNSSSARGPTVDVVQEQTTPGGAWVSTTILTIAIIPTIFAIVFHAGAAYLSYQRNQSVGWAILSFFFAVFYYPYYAFAQAGTPAPAPASTGILPTVQSAGKRLAKALGGKRK